MEKICGIYCIENLVNNKKYVGLSIDIMARFRKHKNQLRNNQHNNRHLQSAWNIDGEANFVFLILEQCNVDELDIREQYYISLWNLQNPDQGYNIEPGGFHNKHISQESRDKISASLQGRPCSNGARNALIEYNQTRVFTDETRKKMRDNHPDMSGENNPMFGKHFSDDTKHKMSEKRKEYFKTHSHPCNGIQKTKEQREKQSLTLTGKYTGENSFNKKSIYCIELDMTFITVKAGSEYVNIKPSCISDHLHGGQKSAGKHPSTNEPLHWLYLEDAIKLGYITEQND